MLGKITIVKKSGKTLVIENVQALDVTPQFIRISGAGDFIIAMFNWTTVDEILYSDRLDSHNSKYELVKEPIVGAGCTNFN